MCKWGDMVAVTVNGGTFDVDSCISDLVFALNKAGLKTVASCCGHSKRPANIALADGREIVICPDFATARKIDDYLDSIGFGPINPLSDGLGDHGNKGEKMTRKPYAVHPKWIPLEKAKGKKVRHIGSATEGDPVRHMDICINFTDGTSLVVGAKAELEFEFLEAE